MTQRPPMERDVNALREVLHNALVRYLTVKPRGLELRRGSPLRRSVDARILGFGGARTLYRQRKPTCRSLDGVRPITGDRNRRCTGCPDHGNCTPQVRVDLIVDSTAFRLLLAHTSAKAFLAYEGELRQRQVAVEHVLTKITVADRGRWGELRFSALD